MSKLSGKVAIVTGGSSGIGLATAKLFAKEGAKVVITGRNNDALNSAKLEIGGDVLTIQADASKYEHTQRVINTTVEAFGGIDILFANAGIAPFNPVAETPEEVFDSVIGTNLKGPFFLVKEAIPHLKEGGVVAFNTTVAHTKGFANTGAYVASKGGLRSLVRVLTSELSTKGIRTVAVSPGPIETPIYGKLGLSENQIKELGQGFASQVPLGRFGSSEEVAKSVLFLVSDDSSYINGVELAVDGGLSQV